MILDSLIKDVAFAARSLRRTPGLALAIVGSIGLGIAANTVVFSMVNELVLRDMPVRDPDRLRVVVPNESASSYPEYLDFRGQATAVLEGLAAHTSYPVPANLSAAGAPLRVWGQLVSGNWFGLTGVPLYLGRGILPFDDEARGRGAVVVLGYGLWRRLGADPALPGKRIVLSGVSYRVVGVTAPAFFGTDRGIAAEFWAPLSMRTHLAPNTARNENKRNCQWLEMTGRLREGVGLEQARAALNVIYTRMLAEHEDGRKAHLVVLHRVGWIPLFEDRMKLLLKALTAVTALVLLIACANVANLLLARAASRQQEIAVRRALGASRGRLVRQLLTESFLVAAAGAALGLGLSLPGTSALARLQPPLPVPMRFDFSPDGRVLGFTTLLAALTAILFGLAPALAGTRDPLAGTRFRRNRLSRALVGVQVGLSACLLAGSGLFLRSLREAASIDTGMKPRGVLMLAIDPMGQGYAAEKSKQFFLDLQQRVEALPGVDSMSYVDLPPLSLAVNGAEFADADSAPDKGALGDSFRVGAHYFQATGIELLRGRDFDAARDEKAPALIINQALARRVFGEADPVGRHLRINGDEGLKVYEIIGVVRNAKSETLFEGERACAFRYFSDFKKAFSLFGVTAMVRTSGNPLRLGPALRRQVDALDRDLPLFNVERLSDHMDEALLAPRVAGGLFGTFAAIGLVLGGVGLYGVLNYSVRTRTREIGVRLALGAGRASVAGMLGRQGLALIATGLATGMAAAFALARVLSSLLYGVEPNDPVTFLAVPAVMLATGGAAIALPALRASRIEPAQALRCE